MVKNGGIGETVDSVIAYVQLILLLFYIPCYDLYFLLHCTLSWTNTGGMYVHK